MFISFLHTYMHTYIHSATNKQIDGLSTRSQRRKITESSFSYGNLYHYLHNIELRLTILQGFHQGVLIPPLHQPIDTYISQKW